jgi:hypothetical protein
MAHQLGHNQYGKAETRVVRIYRDGDPHEIVDYNVSAALSGHFADTHLGGQRQGPHHGRGEEHRQRGCPQDEHLVGAEHDGELARTWSAASRCQALTLG